MKMGIKRNLFRYSAGVYCGVVVNEKVMKKLAKLQTKHLEEVKLVLSAGAGRGEVFPHMWTLYYPDGEQEHVDYIDTSGMRPVEDAISNATHAHPPLRIPLCFIAESMEDARKQAEELHETTGGSEK